MRKLTLYFFCTVLIGLGLVIWGFSQTMDAIASTRLTERDAYAVATPIMHQMCDDTPVCGKVRVYGLRRVSAREFVGYAGQLHLRREGGGCVYEIRVTAHAANLTDRFACINGPEWDNR